MKTALVGYTGFVGSNLSASYEFTNLYNSKNIQEAWSTEPDLLVYAGVSAEKYLANQNQAADLQIINNAFDNIYKIRSKKLVLISTIDVYKNPVAVDEDTRIHTDELQPYGADRYYLETKVRELYPDVLILRLPGLFGNNLKKNFIYDYIHIIPAMLKVEKFDELLKKEPTLINYYLKQKNNFYKCKILEEPTRAKLKEIFQSLGFSALNFTDSRGVFQFYNLKHLWSHIEFALNHDIKILNLATEPIEVAELYQYLTNTIFINHVAKVPPYYNFKTKYDRVMGGENGYLYKKETILKEIRDFIQEQL